MYRKTILEMGKKPPSLQTSEDGEGVQRLTERQTGKRPQEIPVDNTQPIVPATSADITAVLAALR
ncbi:hypothetical protein A2U01_0075331 [Trifolium medium]|uniref:Uncharacterized protein n=1 Tax=Trifolium medium TaxID=97028 RepID=A0A392T0R5_9FABA|nr:hypothetical protein [Trifolium medium]